MPGIPMNPSVMSSLSSFCLEAPGPVAVDLIIAVKGPSFKPHEHEGGLQRVTPEEMRIAYCHANAKTVPDYNEVVAVGRTHDALADLTEKIKQWRRHTLTCTFERRVLASHDDI